MLAGLGTWGYCIHVDTTLSDVDWTWDTGLNLIRLMSLDIVIST